MNKPQPRIFYPKCRANIAMIVYDPATGTESDLLTLAALPVVRCSVKCNDIGRANEFSVEFIESLFPIDPTNIRAMEIDLHLSNGEPNKELTTVDDSTRIIVGHADEISREMREGEVTFKIKGRDFAGLLLDLKWGNRTVELNRTLQQIIEEILGEYPQSAALEVVSRGAFFLKGDVKSKKRNRFTLASDTSVWEGIVKLANKAGAIVDMVFDQVILLEPRTPDKASDPAVFIEGKNLKSLSLTRQLGKNDIPNIRLKCYDPSTAKTLVGTYPSDAEKRVMVSKNKASDTITWKEFIVKRQGATQSSLDADAKVIHQRLSSKQVTLEFTTADLMTQTSNAQCVPTTNLRNGSTIRIYIDNKTRNLLQKNISDPDRRRQLAAAGFSKQVIETIGSQADVVDRLLFVEQATHEFSLEGGYLLSIVASSYLEI